MISQKRLARILILMCAFLSACGPSGARLDTTATQVSVNEIARQTANAPTPTSTFTPRPTATQTPPPTPTLSPTSTTTPLPTPSGEWADINTSYQYLYILDFSAEEIITTTVLLNQGTIDKNQANNRIQLIHHMIRYVESALHYGENPYDPGIKYPYKAEINQATIELSQACKRWWRGELDAQALGQEVTTTRENFQPQLNTLHGWLWSQEIVDVSFTGTFDAQFADFGATSEQVMDYDASSDIFLMQREHRSTWWGLASTLGTYAYEKGYTSPDNTFTCNFAFSGIDGDLLYDFVFPDHTSVVFTNDFSVGQAVERYPLNTQPDSSEAAQSVVNALFEGTILPALKQQHADMRIVDQKWIELTDNSPQEALQVVVELPKSSFIYEDAGSGPVQLDVLRGLLIYVKGDAAYIISYQDDISTWEDLTEAERINRVEAGLIDIQESCIYTLTSPPMPTTTQTAAPALTSTPSQSLVPTSTKNPLAGEFVDGKLILTDEAFNQLLSRGEDFNMYGYYLFEAFLYEAVLEYGMTTDQLHQVYDLQHASYEQLGNYDLAVENLQHIIDLGYRQAGFLNDLCWDLGLINRPKEALPYCEEAVENDPSGVIRDSRGLVYAMLGKYPEAASDFEAALKEDIFSDDEKIQRQEWVVDLKAGDNPITEKVLAQIREEEISMDVDPWYTGNLTISYLIDAYEEASYTFSEATINGQPGFIGSFQDGNCRVELILLGNRQEFMGGSSTIVGCSDEDLDTHISYFVGNICKDAHELAKSIVWEKADLFYVIEGKASTDLNPTFGGFEFSVERINVEGNEGIVVTAKPAE